MGAIVPARATSDAPGELALVLHTHLPHVDGHGVWPVGEEWLLQAWGTSWLPLTRALERLAADGHRDVLTLSVTPTTAWQVADPRLGAELAGWLAAAMWRSEEQRWHHRMGADITALGPHWWRHFRDLAAYHDEVRSRGGLLAVWDDLARHDVIELLAGPATHPYLPLEADPAIIDAQLVMGLTAHRTWTTHTGGLWPPELGYRPAGQVADPTCAPRSTDRHGTPTLRRSGPTVPGLEEHYARHGITHIVVDGPTLIRAAGGADRDWTRRPVPHDPRAGGPEEILHRGVRIGTSDVVAFGRDLSVAYHVWSPTDGYPGHAEYLDHHATGGYGVHRSWRVTDRTLPPDRKQPYVPADALARAAVDADHFVGVVTRTLAARPDGLVVAAYDTELFGHWWHEGVDWLTRVIEQVAAAPHLRTTTLARRLARRPPAERLTLPESSWGYAKGHASWVTPETRDMWSAIRDGTDRARTVLATGRGGAGLRRQLARELTLLRSSDWPFMVTRGQSAGYGMDRVAGHAARVHELCTLIAAGASDTAQDLSAADRVPPDPGPMLTALGG
jgi:1,4-alpha-glucan branching enzyme